MPANSLTVNQISTVLNSIVSQATGQAQITPTNGAEFITVAQTGLKAGYENLMGAVSQVLSRTIFANRPYTRKFKGLEADSIRYGNHVRKINYIDGTWQDNGYLPITDDVAVDQQKPIKPKVLQTNYYGQDDYEIQWTLFRDQLYTAFQSPDELGAFITGQVQNISDRVEQKHETLARAVLCNLISGIYTIGNTNQIVHALTEYNAATGLKLTSKTVYNPDNFPSFMRWLYARISSISSMLTERSVIYHQNVTGKDIPRHTPEMYQRCYLYAPTRYQTAANVLSTTYHDNYLNMPVTETVNFWQSINSPDEINMTPVYMDKTGDLKSPEAPVSISNLFGIITDVETAGYTICNNRSTSAPYNGRGEYQNFWMKFTDRYWNDFTENAVIILLD